jgi:hypothetical protein
VIDGALTRVAEAGDIVTREQFQDFELELEWKVAPGGNSGIFYRVREAPEVKWSGRAAPKPRFWTTPVTRTAPAPRLQPVPATGSTPRRAGWCAPRASGTVCRFWCKGRVEHWLNGRRVVAERSIRISVAS